MTYKTAFKTIPPPAKNRRGKAGAWSEQDRESAQAKAAAKPNFFVVGAPKCGTTALTAYLAAHPEIFMARKEMHFFGRDLRFESNFYRRAEREYLAEFNLWDGQPRLGEASVWYLFSRTAATEIKAFNPESRIIIMLRNPAEMLHAMHYQFCLDRNEHLLDFREALAAQKERQRGRRISRNTYFKQGLIYSEIPRFSEQIRRYFDIFGRERVQIVIYDDFAMKTSAIVGEVLEFLGVNPAQRPNSFPVVNGSHSFKTPMLQTVMSDPLVRGTAIALRSWLPRPIFTALQKIESRLARANIQPHKRPPMDPDLQQMLQVEFTPEVERLSELLGRDLTHWNNWNTIGTL